MINEKEEKFLKINIVTIVLVTGFYGIIKLFSGMIPLVIGIFISLAVIVGVFLFLYKIKVSFYIRALIITSIQLLLIFVISTSGNELSDDYILYLASAAMSGVYFKPSFILIQVCFVDIFLAYTYVARPEQLGDSSQMTLCIVCLHVTYLVVFMLVKRGQSYIKQAQDKAIKTEELLGIIQNTQKELQESFAITYNEIDNMVRTSSMIEESGNILLDSNGDINQKVVETDQIVVTMFDYIGQCVESMEHIMLKMKNSNSVVKENEERILTVDGQLLNASQNIENINLEVNNLQSSIKKIEELAEQNQKIAVKTNILAINASIEAARGGGSGAGFTVVANEVRKLANNSSKCSDEISEEIQRLNSVISTTQKYGSESFETMDACNQNLVQLKQSFVELTQSFSAVSESIEQQNSAVSSINNTCSKLVDNMKFIEHSAHSNTSNVSELVSKICGYNKSVSLIKINADNVKVLADNICD